VPSRTPIGRLPVNTSCRSYYLSSIHSWVHNTGRDTASCRPIPIPTLYGNILSLRIRDQRRCGRKAGK